MCLIAETNFVTPSSEHSVNPLIFSVCKADNSGSNWPSASATADVRLISLNSSFSRGLCLITSINLVTASAENSGHRFILSSRNTGNSNCKLYPSEPLISSFCRDGNSGNDWTSVTAAADVRFIPLSCSSSRVLCLIPVTNFATASSEDSVKPLIFSVCKADNSGNAWPRAMVAADVRFILLSFSSLRVLCLIAVTNFVTASSEHSIRPLTLNVRKADNSGSDWASDPATVDVRFMRHSSSSSRVLCLIAETNFVTASSEHSTKSLIFSVFKADNSGSSWPSALASADVRWISVSSSTSRRFCLITSINLVTNSAENSGQSFIFSSGNTRNSNCKLHPSEPLIVRLCRDGNSGNDWPSATATADVRFIPLSSSSSRVLCLIPAKSFVPASAEHKVTSLIFSVCKADNSGSDWRSDWAAAVVR